MIATARANAHRHVELLLADQLAPKRCVELDALLAGGDGHTSGIASRRRRHGRVRGATNTDDELLATLKRIRAAHDRFIDEPVELLPKTSGVGARRNDGRVQRTRYELCLWFLARDALRAGRLYRPIGRRYADAAGFLMPADRGAATWPAAPSAAGSRSAWIAATTIASSPSVQAMRNGARAIRASSTQNVVGSCETRPRG
jgi:hypothetical protein